MYGIPNMSRHTLRTFRFPSCHLPVSAIDQVGNWFATKFNQVTRFIHKLPVIRLEKMCAYSNWM